MFCRLSSRLGVALELTPDLPDNPKELARWEGEPVQALILPTDIFLTNKKGFPCLSKAHQDFVVNMYRVRAVSSLKPPIVVAALLMGRFDCFPFSIVQSPNLRERAAEAQGFAAAVHPVLGPSDQPSAANDV